MLLSEALQILKDNGYEINEPIDESIGDVLSSIGGAGLDFGVFAAQSYGCIFLIKALFRFIGSHWNTKQLKDILNKVENDKDKFTDELLEILNKKIVHRPITDLNDDELAEAIEKLLQYYSGVSAIYKELEELKHYKDTGYGSIYDKIKSNLNTTYRSVYQLFYNLIKLKYETNQTHKDDYEDAIYTNLENLYYLTKAKANLKRAFNNAFPYKVNGDKQHPDDRLDSYIFKQRQKNIEFDEKGNLTGHQKHYKTGYDKKLAKSFFSGDKK